MCGLPCNGDKPEEIHLPATMSLSQAAKLLGISRKRLNSLIENGLLTPATSRSGLLCISEEVRKQYTVLCRDAGTPRVPPKHVERVLPSKTDAFPRDGRPIGQAKDMLFERTVLSNFTSNFLLRYYANLILPSEPRYCFVDNDLLLNPVDLSRIEKLPRFMKCQPDRDETLAQVKARWTGSSYYSFRQMALQRIFTGNNVRIAPEDDSVVAFCSDPGEPGDPMMHLSGASRKGIIPVTPGKPIVHNPRGERLTYPLTDSRDVQFRSALKQAMFELGLFSLRLKRGEYYCPIDGPVKPVFGMFSSPAWTWAEMCGRGFTEALCPACFLHCALAGWSMN